jgi:hypothetical protein
MALLENYVEIILLIIILVGDNQPIYQKLMDGSNDDDRYKST